MAETKSPVLHILQEDDLASLFPHPPLLSSALRWDALNAIYHRQPPGEAPDSCGPLHTLILYPEREQCVPTERVIDGKRLYKEHTAGDVVIVPANTVARTSWDSENESMMLFLDPTFVAQVAYEFIDPDQVEILPEFATPDPMICQIGMMIKAELEFSNIYNRLYVDSLATMLAVRLLRQYSTQRIEVCEDQIDVLPNSKLRKAIAYINDYLSEDLSLSAISAEFGMSPSYFNTLFKGATGTTIYQYVIQRRVEISKRLLACSDLPIIEIVYQVGFQSQNYFHNVFRKYTGLTPKAYRMAHK
jgi:AraC family transcriptional regulator